MLFYVKKMFYVLCEDVFNLLSIRGSTRGEGMPGIEPGSPDPLSNPLPQRQRHRGERNC